MPDTALPAGIDGNTGGPEDVGTGNGLEAIYMPLRAELYCFFCGHGCGDVLVPARGRKPTPEQLHAAYASVPETIAPVWDEAGQPACPRCGGQLFLERYGQEAARRPERLRRAS